VVIVVASFQRWYVGAERESWFAGARQGGKAHCIVPLVAGSKLFFSAIFGCSFCFVSSAIFGAFVFIEHGSFAGAELGSAAVGYGQRFGARRWGEFEQGQSNRFESAAG
jgi:hypothetical protein